MRNSIVSLVALFALGCSAGGQDDATSHGSDSQEVQGFNVDSSVKTEALRFSTWIPQGTVAFRGGRLDWQYPIIPIAAGYLLLEAPAWCAPRALGVTTTLYPFGVRTGAIFQGQQNYFGTIRAVYRIESGATTWISGVGVSFSGWNACPVNVYTATSY